MRLLFSTFLLFISAAVFAKTDTVETYSPSMKKKIKAVVVTPDGYDGKTALPVVYLLHGHSGNYADWVKNVPETQQYANQYRLIVVCPDGNYDSWYLDSPMDKNWKYETYVSGELVSWIDEHYKTIRDRKGRGITGLSMGGHGALYLAFRHQDVFGAAGSMSGGVDIRPFPKNWELADRLGKYSEYPENWEKNTVINLVHLLEPSALALAIECGTDDFFYTVNKNLHEKLLERNIPHDFTLRPGAHNWEYWKNALPYQLLFMHRYFGGGK
ncbi:MAG: esterase family protein [Mucilaginibacter polytrichastri]|nr:esterase family protein [Mucilaginibacter polytrichastri]